MAPGSIVEPGTVKRFKSRLNDGHIVDVSQQDFEKWQKYFKERIGVELKMPEQPEQPAQPVKPNPEPEKVAKIVKPAAVVVKAH